MTEPTREVDLTELDTPGASGEPGELAMVARQRSAQFSIVEEPQGAGELTETEQEQEVPPAPAQPQPAPVASSPPSQTG